MSGAAASERPRFIVDINAGKCARLLRLLGYDTVLYGHGADADMVARALKEGRVLVSRDQGIAARRVVTNGDLRMVLLTSDDAATQLRQLVAELGLDDAQRFSRCLECNLPLESRDREAVRGRVPPYVFKTQTQFSECPRCGRLYWPGTHWEAMVSRLDSLGFS